MLQLLRQRDVLQHISVTPREIDQFLEKQAKAPAENNEYNVSHILIAVGQEASPAQLDAAAKRAQDVYQRAKGGEDFAKLAVAYSNSQTALDGGSLGWRKGSELPTFLSETIARLKPGEVSEPLRTPTGYHIIRLNEVRGTYAFQADSTAFHLAVYASKPWLSGALFQVLQEGHARHAVFFFVSVVVAGRWRRRSIPSPEPLTRLLQDAWRRRRRPLAGSRTPRGNFR